MNLCIVCVTVVVCLVCHILFMLSGCLAYEYVNESLLHSKYMHKLLQGGGAGLGGACLP